jgi:type IV secretory pathway VirB2 component (pilin)
VHGNGNALKQDMPAPPPKQSMWQKIRWPLAGLLGTAGVVAAGIMLFAPTTRAGLWLLGAFKRKASTDTATV